MTRTCPVLLVVLVACSVCGAREPAGIPAFPGAQGWGRNASGGRAADARVLFVTSLADSGAGTLREALDQAGPRIVVFKTGGVIDLASPISIRNDHLTIAGQTAPGDGIIVRNFPVRIAACNVIMRGLRIRPGDGPGPKGDLRDGVQVGSVNDGQKHDIIVDRCSFGWSADETVELWYSSRNVTFSNNVFSEALWNSIHHKGGHGYAMLIANGENHFVTVARNLFAHNDRRNPWVKGNAKVEIVNNVVYNWGTEGTGLWGSEEKVPSLVHVIGNYYKPGPDTAYHVSKGGRGINLSKPAIAGSKFYVRGNLGPGRAGDEQDDWDAVTVGPAVDVQGHRAGEPLPGLASGLTVLPAHEAFEAVLTTAGAVPRDAADRRAVDDARRGAGRHLDDLSSIGGYPRYAPGSYPPDADDDGMPDAWERARGLDPNDAADATRPSSSGYLNIEEYANGLLDVAGGPGATE